MTLEGNKKSPIAVFFTETFGAASVTLPPSVEGEFGGGRMGDVHAPRAAVGLFGER